MCAGLLPLMVIAGAVAALDVVDVVGVGEDVAPLPEAVAGGFAIFAASGWLKRAASWVLVTLVVRPFGRPVPCAHISWSTRSPRRRERGARWASRCRGLSRSSNSLAIETWTPDRSVSRPVSYLGESGRCSRPGDARHPLWTIHMLSAHQFRKTHDTDKPSAAGHFRSG